MDDDLFWPLSLALQPISVDSSPSSSFFLRTFTSFHKKHFDRLGLIFCILSWRKTPLNLRQLVAVVDFLAISFFKYLNIFSHIMGSV
jgi:hypothetical protein